MRLPKNQPHPNPNPRVTLPRLALVTLVTGLWLVLTMLTVGSALLWTLQTILFSMELIRRIKGRGYDPPARSDYNSNPHSLILKI